MKRSKPGIDDSKWVRKHSESQFDAAFDGFMNALVGLPETKEATDAHPNSDERTDGTAESGESPA